MCFCCIILHHLHIYTQDLTYQFIYSWIALVRASLTRASYTLCGILMPMRFIGPKACIARPLFVRSSITLFIVLLLAGYLTYPGIRKVFLLVPLAGLLIPPLGNCRLAPFAVKPCSILVISILKDKSQKIRLQMLQAARAPYLVRHLGPEGQTFHHSRWYPGIPMRYHYLLP
jgi:hypothetical protein